MSAPSSNYLPVLLVSVSTNAAPDDSYVSTRPRGQVDYLSHEWQEEDVWRSWRNMTRQKNEIANGARLENASWRTWWKQRNKLKTVSPETLNWLKDSDVTWLYGPLHTASDDKPLQKASSSEPAATSVALHKPILKYRSITELLKSDLPTSPVFSHDESEEQEDDYDNAHQSHLRYPPVPDDFSPGSSLPRHAGHFPRPKLQHTKSDTHITRWGPNRAYRKDSPPRIEPPGHTETVDYFPPVSASGPVRTSLSQDSNSSAGNSTERTTKKKHISFNTFVEQVIALDKPKRSSSFYEAKGRQDYDDGYDEDEEDSSDEHTFVRGPWSQARGQIRSPGINGYPYPDDIEEEEEEEDEGIIEMRSSFRNATPQKSHRSHSKVSNTSSSSSASTTSSSATNSTANSSTSPIRGSGSLSSTSTAKRSLLARRGSASAYRPHHLVRQPSEHHMHVTIAPIAPAVLKTTEVWEEGFGDDGAGSDDGFGWRERLWGSESKGKGRARGRGRAAEDDQASDASGTPVELVYVPPFANRHAFGYGGYEEEEEEEDEVDELVYGAVGGTQGFDDDDLDEGHFTSFQQDGAASAVYLHRGTAAGSVGFEDYEPDNHSHHPHHAPIGSGSAYPRQPGAGIPIPIPMNGHTTDLLDASLSQGEGVVAHSIPKVMVIEQAGSKIPNMQDEDDNDFFDGDADYGNEYTQKSRSRQSRPSYRKHGKYPAVEDERTSRSTSRTVSSRSRSKSHSRTPSPAIDGVIASIGGVQVQGSVPAHVKRTQSSSSSPAGSHHLSPPTRGRSQELAHSGRTNSSSSLHSQGSRGRSSSRASAGPPSLESSSSPFGSLSPDGSKYASASAYTGGGRLERDRERRGRESGGERRGRDRTTDKRLSASVSASPDPPRVMKRETSSTTDTTSATGSSTSSSRTIVPQQEEQQLPQPSSSSGAAAPGGQGQQQKSGRRQLTEQDFQREAEEFLRRTHPTPSNSPVIEMKAPLLGHRHQHSTGGTTPTPASIAAAAELERERETPMYGSAPSSSSTPLRANGNANAPWVATPSPKKISAVQGTRPAAPLNPTPPYPALPSTVEYNALSSPTSPTAKVASAASSSQQHLIASSTTSSAAMVASPTVGLSTPPVLGSSVVGNLKGTSLERGEATIIEKAQEMVSHAGAFFGLWDRA